MGPVTPKARYNIPGRGNFSSYELALHEGKRGLWVTEAGERIFLDGVLIVSRSRKSSHTGGVPATCPYCGRTTSTYPNGRFRRHVVEPGVPCPGSGRFPADLPR